MKPSALSMTVATCLALMMTASVRGEAQPPNTVTSPALTAQAPLTLANVHGRRIAFISIGQSVSISLEDCTGITIYCCDLRSVRLRRCKDIAIENCWIHDGKESGIDAYSCENVRIQGCRIENVASGLYALECRDMRFIGNYVQNVRGPLPRGQMVQFDKVKGAGNAISNNYCVNFRGKSAPEDVISIYKSEGGADSPILIEGNFITGDPSAGSAGKSDSGSGIMLGDGGGSHITCRKNTILSAGQAGIGVAGGETIIVEDNVVIGARSEVSNVGIYAWNQSKRPGGMVCVVSNRVCWTDKNGKSNSWWDGGGFAMVDAVANRFDDKTLLDHPPAPPTTAPIPPRSVAVDGVIALPWK